jgi:hypothetical protein
VWLLDRLNWEARLNATVKELPSASELGSREDLYRYVSDMLLDGGKRAIDYFEFGVYEGASISFWCTLSKNADSRFFGFDPFEGLPKDCTPATLCAARLSNTTRSPLRAATHLL